MKTEEIAQAVNESCWFLRTKALQAVRASQALNKLPRPARVGVLLLASLVPLVFLYLGVALRIQYNAEHAALMLMAKSMLAGNVLLRGWALGTQPYYTTELPFYALGILMLGFSWKVIYVVTALHWALVVLLTIYLSVTGEGGPATPNKVLIAFCMTLFLPGVAIGQSWLSFAHLVGFLYCLVCLLAIRKVDQTGQKRYYALFVVFLTLAAVGDVFAIYLMAIPVLMVCLVRIVVYGARGTIVALSAATALSAVISRMVLSLIVYLGGAYVRGPPAEFVALPALGENLYALLAGILDLFGIEFFGKAVASSDSLIGLVRLSGLCLFAVTMSFMVRRIRHVDLATQITITIIVANLLEFLFSGGVGVGATRYLAPTLILGIIVVSGVIFKSAAFRDRQKLVLLYFLMLFLSLVPRLSSSKPASPADNLGRLLVRLHLTNGYGPYWRSDNTTLATAGQAWVSPVYLETDGTIRPCLAPRQCFSDRSWYANPANFMIVDAQDPTGELPTREDAIRVFGIPSNEYELYKYGHLLVWGHDITPYLTWP